jgi:plastocyanin
MAARGLAALALAAGAAFLCLAGPALAAELTATEDADFSDPRFEPFELTAAPGETVTVHDAFDQHTFTSVADAWPELVLNQGETRSVAAPAQAGDYRFYCRYHSSREAQPGDGMAGVLHVRAGAPPDSKPTPLGAGLAPLALASAALLAAARRKA